MAPQTVSRIFLASYGTRVTQTSYNVLIPHDRPENDTLVRLNTGNGCTFELKKHILRFYSGFFARLLYGTTVSHYIFTFPEHAWSAPEIFNMWCIWMDTGMFMATPGSLDPHFGSSELDFATLVKLNIFSRAYDTPLAENMTMDELIQKILEAPTEYPTDVDTFIRNYAVEGSQMQILNDSIRNHIDTLKVCEHHMDHAGEDGPSTELLQQHVDARASLNKILGGWKEGDSREMVDGKYNGIPKIP